MGGRPTQDRPKRQIAPRWPAMVPDSPLDAPKIAPRGPNLASRWSKMAQTALKMPPGCRQNHSTTLRVPVISYIFALPRRARMRRHAVYRFSNSGDGGEDEGRVHLRTTTA